MRRTQVSPHNKIESPAIPIGITQTIRLARFSPNGVYLTPIVSKDSTNCTSQMPQILLPNKFITPQHRLNDDISVFVYTDSNDRPIATTQIPKAQCGDIATLQVVGHSPFGCFLDLGLDKDIFMPCKNPTRFALNISVCVFITLDKQSRLIAKCDIKPHLKKAMLKPHSKVNAFLFESSPLGFGCVVEGQYYGLLYHNQIPQGECIKLGASIHAYTQGYRADGKLDLTLFTPHNTAQKQMLLDSMPLSLHFDASPEQIFERFKISKKLFKRLINELTREGKIAFMQNEGVFKQTN